MCLIRITEDVFDVCDRLKSVDERYKLFYNAKKRRYEVYVEDKLAFVVPFDSLDARTVEYARMTRVERAAEILRRNGKRFFAVRFAAKEKYENL